MLGDKIVIKPHHTKAPEGVYPIIKRKIDSLSLKGQPVAITIAGESGSGKSEIASEISRIFSERDNIKSFIFHQDDYFIRPPKTNDEARKQKIENVGMHEVRMDLLDKHISYVKQPLLENKKFKKPLIDYDNNIILEETVNISDVEIVLIEGTYTTALKNADIRVFIDRTYIDTLQHRKERGRDKLDAYTEKILKIEHDIISSQKKNADIIIDKNYHVL